MSPDPIITGVGLATPLGATLESTWSALLAGGAISDHALVPGLATEAHRFDSLVDLVADAALHDAGLNDGPGSDAAIILGTSKGPIVDWLKPTGGAVQSCFGLSAPAARLARRLRTTGPCITLSAACSSGLHALIHATMLIGAGTVRRALVVGVESSIHPLFLGSFTRLGVLAKPGESCRPFDRHRSGFLMSEAAAAVVLESGSPGLVRSADPAIARHFTVIEGFALGADATHLTGGDAEAKALSMLIRRVIDGRPIDLVHAHGTGTIANDELELATIEANLVNSPRRASLYSHKGALGHSLGAAGLVSVVLNRQCHRFGAVPPNGRTTSPLKTQRLSLDQNANERPVQRSLAVAAGFGGALAVVSLIDNPITHLHQ